jgi:hypothetical protein
MQIKRYMIVIIKKKEIYDSNAIAWGREKK